jgi:hypothetical protein
MTGTGFDCPPPPHPEANAKTANKAPMSERIFNGMFSMAWVWGGSSAYSCHHVPGNGSICSCLLGNKILVTQQSVTLYSTVFMHLRRRGIEYAFLGFFHYSCKAALY